MKKENKMSKYKAKKDCSLFIGTPPRLKVFKKDDDITFSKYDSIESQIKQGFAYEVKEEAPKEPETNTEEGSSEENEDNIESEADLSAENEVNEESDNDTQESSSDDLKAIFNANPKKLTIPELKSLCDELGVKYRWNTKESKLIEKLQAVGK